MSLETESKVHKYITYILCTFLMVTVLWKGGKAIDATWLYSGLAWLCAVDMAINKKRLSTLPVILHICSIVFVSSTVLAFLYSLTANFGFDEVLRTVSGVIVMYWVASFAGLRTSLFNRVAACTTVALITAIAVGAAVYIVQPVNRFVGSFFDYRFHTDYWPNAWGDYLLGAWPLAIWYLYSRMHYGTTNKAKAFLYTVLLPSTMLAALLLSYSRGSVIAFLGQLLLAGGLCLITKLPVFTKQVGKKVLLIILIAFSLFIGINEIRSKQHAIQSVAEKVTFTASEGAISINERQQFWQQAVVLFKERPIFGWGPYSWRFIQPRLQQHVLATSDHPHNVFLKFAVERGIFATIAFAGILLLASLGAFKTVIKRSLTSQLKLPAIVCIVSLAGLIAHNLIDYNLQFVGITLLLWLVIGFSMNVKNNVQTTTVPTFLILLATITVSVALYESYFIGLSTFGRRAFATGNDPVAAEYFEQTRQALFSRDLHVGLMDIYVRTNQPDKALDVFKEYRGMNDQDARGWKLAADAYRLKRDFTMSAMYYQEALRLSTFNDIGITRWYVQTLINSGMKEVVVQNRNEYDTRINEFQLAIMNGVHHISLSKNVEELAALLDLFATIFPASEVQYSTLKKTILQKAQKDRDFVASRAPGLLW